MSIILRSEQEQFIQEKLKTGKYQTVDEVITEAFQLLEEHDRHDQEWLNETREKVTIGLAELDRREGVDGEMFVNQLLAEFKQAKENH